jgi:hypothetical protein
VPADASVLVSGGDIAGIVVAAGSGGRFDDDVVATTEAFTH